MATTDWKFRFFMIFVSFSKNLKYFKFFNAYKCIWNLRRHLPEKNMFSRQIKFWKKSFSKTKNKLQIKKNEISKCFFILKHCYNFEVKFGFTINYPHFIFVVYEILLLNHWLQEFQARLVVKYKQVLMHFH